MKKLNLGAGNRIETDAINHDVSRHRPEIQVVHDLNDLPWPWPDNSFDRIIARSVFEHLRNNLVETLNECWRIMKPGGTMFIKLPHWKSDVAYWDVTHYWHFSLHSLDQFDPDTERGKDYGFYTPHKWKIVSIELNQAQSSILSTMAVRK